jgi:hypothetical protein
MRTWTLLPLGLGIALLQGCHARYGGQVDPHTIAPTPSEGTIEGRPTLGKAMAIPGERTVIVPFAVETRKGLFESDDPYDRGGISTQHPARVRHSVGQSAAYSGSVRWHNAIIRDLDSGQEWPVLDQRGIIGEWYVMTHQAVKDGPWVSRAVVFIAVVDDTNKDGVLDNRDARIAIVADADGRNPRIVTPRDGQVWSVDFDNPLGAIFLQVASDTSGDGKVDFDDSAAPYFVLLGDRGRVQRVVSEGALRRMESLLERQSGAGPAGDAARQDPPPARAAR